MFYRLTELLKINISSLEDENRDLEDKQRDHDAFLDLYKRENTNLKDTVRKLNMGHGKKAAYE